MTEEDIGKDKPYESGWNLAQHIIQELADLLKRASNYYVDGNYSMATNCLRAIRLRITQDLTSEEKKKLIGKETNIYVQTVKATPVGFTMTSENSVAALRVFTMYGEYNDVLMECLKNYKYLIPPKKDTTRFN